MYCDEELEKNIETMAIAAMNTNKKILPHCYVAAFSVHTEGFAPVGIKKFMENQNKVVSSMFDF